MKLRTVSFVVIGALVLAATPVSAYWQFMIRPAGAEIKPSPRYASKEACEAALQQTEAALKKRYPDRYPLVGSCEEFR